VAQIDRCVWGGQGAEHPSKVEGQHEGKGCGWPGREGGGARIASSTQCSHSQNATAPCMVLPAAAVAAAQEQCCHNSLMAHVSCCCVLCVGVAVCVCRVVEAAEATLRGQQMVLLGRNRLPALDLPKVKGGGGSRSFGISRTDVVAHLLCNHQARTVWHHSSASSVLAVAAKVPASTCFVRLPGPCCYRVELSGSWCLF
jgi:hypothetical protein